MLANHGSSQQSCKEEYEPWKWDAAARYYASHTKTTSATRKSVPRSSRQSDQTKTLLTIAKRCKLKWYGHVPRSSGLVNTILQGTVKAGRRQGRQRKRWGDNIRAWAGLEFAKSQRAVENRGKWTELVVKSSVVHQRPPRLRDRWRWSLLFTVLLLLLLFLFFFLSLFLYLSLYLCTFNFILFCFLELRCTYELIFMYFHASIAANDY